MSIWPYVWIAFMVSLVIATIVAAVRDSRARSKLRAAAAPQPFDHESEIDEPMEFQTIESGEESEDASFGTS